MAIADLKKRYIIDFLDSLKDEDLKDATVNNYHAILKSIINYGINNFDELENFCKYIFQNPTFKT